ncbi:MAG: FG-GAP repeat protein [Bacteroidia bacterium]
MSLPAEAQLAPLFALAARDLNGDGNTDLIVGGNLYRVKPEMGRYDALRGLVMLGDGKGGFKALWPPACGKKAKCENLNL